MKDIHVNTPESGTPALWRLFVMLIVPTLLIIVLITLFVIAYSALGSSDGPDINVLIDKYISYVFILNLALCFLGLVWALRKDGMQLSDIGFRLPDNGEV